MTTTANGQVHEDASASELAELLARRERHLRLLRDVYREFHTWNIGVGKLRIQAAVGTNFIAVAFVLWHLALGTAGVLSILLWEGGRELGIALLVGALFSFGSFLAQFWSQAMDKHREFVEKVGHEDDVRQLRNSLRILTELDQRIDRRLRASRAREEG